MKEFLQTFLDHLKQPEYLHVLLNPLPVYATAMGVIGLVLALVLRSRQAQAIACVIVFIGTASVWPVAYYGDKGADRVQSMSNKAAVRALHEHVARADSAEWVFYLTAAVAFVGIIAAWKFPKILPAVTILTILLAIACTTTAAWISQAGGQIRHSEFRK